LAVTDRHLKLSDLLNPTSRQREFLEAMEKYRYLLYGGARGGGKSYLLRWCLLRQLLRWFSKDQIPGIRVGLFCEDFPTLKDRQISKVQVEFPEDIGRWVASEKEFRLREELGGGVIAFRNLDDPSKYMSSEFAIAAVDELTKNEMSVFTILRGSMRWPGIPDTKFLGATNPGGIGHLWVKSLWIDGIFPPELQDRAAEFGYIKALPTDNPHNDPSYIEELKALPEKMQRAWLQGDWDVFEGQVFEEWRAEVGGEPCHVLPEFKAPPSWSWAGGLDFGHRAYGYLAIGAIGSDEIVIVDEFAFKEMHAKEAGEEAALKLERYPGLDYIAADEEMFYQTGHGPTKAEQFQAGLNEILGAYAPQVIKVTHGRGSRGARLELFHHYLAWKTDEDGKIPPWWAPKLRFHERCKYAISTIPSLPYDQRKIEDVDTHSEDHAYDGVGYLLMSRPGWEEKINHTLEPDTHPGLDARGFRKAQPWTEQFNPPPVTPGVWVPREEDYIR
jgi:hypothetical protein